MKHGSLFSGIGGFDLASERMGWENIFQVEIDPYCRRVLKKNFPNVKRYEDIREFKGQPVDIITGGFPCQPFSNSGKRRGKEDNRYLWPEMLRVIQESNPKFVVAENVTNIDGMALKEVLNDLEDHGYETLPPLEIEASSVGALHRRNRVWIIAVKEDAFDTNANSFGSYNKEEHQQREIELRDKQDREFRQVVPLPIREGTDSRIFGVADGLSDRVDRLKGVGNAIDWRVAYEIFKAIRDSE